MNELTEDERLLVDQLPDHDPAKKLLVALIAKEKELKELGAKTAEYAQKFLEEDLHLQDQPFLPEDWGFQFANKSEPDANGIITRYWTLKGADKPLGIFIRSNGEAGVTTPRFFIENNYHAKMLFKLLHWDDPSLDNEKAREVADGKTEDRKEAIWKKGNTLYHFIELPKGTTVIRNQDSRKYELIHNDEQIIVLDLENIEPDFKIEKVEIVGREQEMMKTMMAAGITSVEYGKIISAVPNALLIQLDGSRSN